MMRKNSYPIGQYGNVLLVIIIGLLISVSLFLAMFITSQRASSAKKYQNLKIPPIQIPTPLPLPKRIIASPPVPLDPFYLDDPSTTSSEFDIAVDEETSTAASLEDTFE